MNKATIYITGEVGKEVTLLDVIRQFKSFKNPTEVEVLINSNGGDVDEGMSIYNYLRKLNLPITTKATKAYSIAASIFMAGDTRLLEEGEDRFMIHMPLVELRGGSKMLAKVQPMLKQIEDDFTEFYSKYTNIDPNSIRQLLENETFLSAKEAQEIGIATGSYELLKAVAYFIEEENLDKNKNKMTKTEKLIKAFTAFLSEDKEVEIKALVLQDANAEDVVFPELEENAQPSVGDKVEGIDREILMPNGSKIIVEAGAVKEIIQPEEEVEQDPVLEPSLEAKEDEVDFSAMFEEMQAKILAKVEATHKEKEEALEAKIVALKKEVGSSIDNDPTLTASKKSTSGNSLAQLLKNKR